VRENEKQTTLPTFPRPRRLRRVITFTRRDTLIATGTKHRAGQAHEHALGAADEHGFLWRMNTYWSYEERDGGLYMQIESVSLSRSVPTGLGWAVRPFVESVPRESMEFTLRSTCNALKK